MKYGIDLSRSMLAAARSTMPRATLIEGDIAARTVAPDFFGRVFIAYNSLYHIHTFSKLLRLFDCVRLHLREGGLFGIDIFNPLAPHHSRRLAETGCIQIGRFVDDRTGESFSVSTRSTIDIQGQLIHQLREFRPERGAPFVQKRVLRFFSPQEIVTALEMSRLKVVHLFGDYERSPMAVTSGQMLFVIAHA
jgi:SAM-dependent methyltransferase